MYVETFDPEVPVTRSLLVAAASELRRFAVPNGADDQVVSNLEAMLESKKGDLIQKGNASGEITQTLNMAASLMDEAATLLSRIDPGVLERVEGYRFPLCDELGGLAGICRDAVPTNAHDVAPAEVDLVARGMGWDQTVSMIREAFEQAGVPWTDASGKEPKAIVINIMQRLANSAHKAGFKLAVERSAAAAAVEAVNGCKPCCSR